MFSLARIFCLIVIKKIVSYLFFERRNDEIHCTSMVIIVNIFIYYQIDL